MKPLDLIIDDFPGVFTSIKDALRNGRMKMPFDEDFASEVHKIESIPLFLDLRKKAFEDYDCLNREVLEREVDNRFPEENDRQFIAEKFESFLILDSKRRAFDEVNNTEGNIIEKAEKVIRRKFEGIFDESDLETLLSLSPFESYEFYRTRLMYSSDIVQENIKDSEYTKKIITDMFLGNQNYFLDFYKKTMRIPKTRIKTIKLINESRAERKESLLREMNNIDAEYIRQFTNLNGAIYFDDPKRHFEVDWFGDYFIRKTATVLLYRNGEINSPDPFNYQQIELYKMISKKKNLEVKK